MPRGRAKKRAREPRPPALSPTRGRFPAGRPSKNSRTGGFLGMELKFLDCGFNSVAINSSSTAAAGEIQPSTGCTGSISVPAMGDAEQERDGRKYVIKSAHVKGVVDYTVESDEGDPLVVPTVFMALVLDTQVNGATIISEQVFRNPSTETAAAVTPFLNLEHSSRYRVLATTKVYPHGTVEFNDATGASGTATGTMIPANTPVVELFWRGEIPVTTTGGTASNVANVSDNALHVVGWAQTQDYTPVFKGMSRVRFIG